MGTATAPEEGDEVATDHPQDPPHGDRSAEPGAVEERPIVVDLTETTKPSRRFYANLAGL